MVLSGEQEKESIIPVGMASLMMPIGDHRDRFIYPTITLMMDSDNLMQIAVINLC